MQPETVATGVFGRGCFLVLLDEVDEGLVGLADIFDPDCIVLSGSMGKFCDVEYMQKLVNDEIVTLPTKILHATSGNYAGMIGAVLLGFDKLKLD